MRVTPAIIFRVGFRARAIDLAPLSFDSMRLPAEKRFYLELSLHIASQFNHQEISAEIIGLSRFYRTIDIDETPISVSADDSL